MPEAPRANGMEEKPQGFLRRVAWLVREYLAIIYLHGILHKRLSLEVLPTRARPAARILLALAAALVIATPLVYAYAGRLAGTRFEEVGAFRTRSARSPTSSGRCPFP